MAQKNGRTCPTRFLHGRIHTLIPTPTSTMASAIIIIIIAIRTRRIVVTTDKLSSEKLLVTPASLG